MSVGEGFHRGEAETGRIRYLGTLILQHARGRAWLWPVLAAALIGLRAVSGMLAATQGEPTAALDDAYIHFQFAKSFARLEPLVYSPGDAAVPGATSWLWPLLLAPFYAVGFRDAALLWPAWALSFVCLGLLAYETWRAALPLLSREAALASAVMVLLFGGLVWGAGSGMEIAPFAWLLMAGARRLADSVDASEAPTRRSTLELIGLAWAASAMRPEGALLAGLIALGLLVRPRGRPRWLALPALAGAFLPGMLNWAFTGTAGSTTTEVKWLFASPYTDAAQALAITLNNVHFLWVTLSNGELHSALVIPRGSRIVMWAALPALAWAGHRTRHRARALIVGALALLLFVPCTYDTFLWNRLRYLWPFAPAWFVGVAAVADALGAIARRVSPALAHVHAVIAGLFAGALLGHLPFSLQDLGESASGIQRQQVSLGRWAKEALPPASRIGVNDAGAIAYFSERRTFDIVGLTTKGEGRYWVAGPGSRFEHYERLGRDRLPTHLIVYPDWLGIPQLFGDWLTERNVTDSTILGGPRMVAYTLSTMSLGSAERPEAMAGRVVDRLDVADLESESAHGYDSSAGASADNLVFQNEARVDGGRSARRRDSFDLKLGRGQLVARVVTDEPLTLHVSCGGKVAGRLSASGAGWEELALDLPPNVPAGLQRVEIRVEPAAAGGPTFAALHYWSVQAH